MLILAYNWWTLALRAAIALVSGALAFFVPSLSLEALVVIFGIYAALDGVLALISGVRRRRVHEPREVLVTLGLVGMLFAGTIALWPGVTVDVLLTMTAGLALLRGVVEGIAGLGLKKQLPDEWMLAIAAGVSIFFGAAMALYPSPIISSARWLIGMYLTAYGTVLLALTYRMRPHRDRRIVPLRVVRDRAA